MTVGEIELTALDACSARVADPDTLLCDRLAQGDLDAVGEIYDRYHEHVRAFARRLVGDATATEDLVQEVFVTLPKAMRRYRGESSLKTFVLSIAVNHSRHHVRAAARRRKAMQRYAEQPEGHSTDPERLVHERQLARVLTEALDSLPHDQRVAFVLCDVEERTSKEVASIVDAPESTVRTRLFHARKKLRSYLEERGIAHGGAS
jgi:RNA polymerase sigma-70 factor (ECF subfamily)